MLVTKLAVYGLPGLKILVKLKREKNGKVPKFKAN